MREYKEVHINYISQTLGTLLLLAALKYTCGEVPMLSEVNKVFKDNPIFVSSLLYFVPTLRLF